MITLNDAVHWQRLKVIKRQSSLAYSCDKHVLYAKCHIVNYMGLKRQHNPYL